MVAVGYSVGAPSRNVKSVPRRSIWGTLSIMSDDEQWYFRVSDKAVVQGKDAGAMDRMGPYPDRATAERALEIAAERNKAADDADDSWSS